MLTATGNSNCTQQKSEKHTERNVAFTRERLHVYPENIYFKKSV